MAQSWCQSIKRNGSEATTGGALQEKVFLKISQKWLENTCAKVSFLILRPATLFKKKTLAQVFFCEFCEFSKNTFFTEHFQTTASDRYCQTFCNNLQNQEYIQC